MLAARRVQSFPPITAVILEDCAFIGADSAISDGNDCGKIIQFYEGFSLLASGSSAVIEELSAVLPCCFKTREPKSIEEILDRVVVWTNFFTEYIRSQVKLILVGAFKDGPFKIGKIKKMKEIAGYVHKRYFVEHRVVTMGSGKKVARSVIEENETFWGKNGVGKESVEDGIETIFDALRKAGEDGGIAGGTLHAAFVTRNGDNVSYCKSQEITEEDANVEEN